MPGIFYVFLYKFYEKLVTPVTRHLTFLINGPFLSIAYSDYDEIIHLNL